MLTTFFNFLSKKLMVKVVFGDHVDVQNDFLYDMEGVNNKMDPNRIN